MINAICTYSCIILFYTISYYILYYTILYYIVLCDTLLHDIIVYYTILYYIVLYYQKHPLCNGMGLGHYNPFLSSKYTQFEF